MSRGTPHRTIRIDDDLWFPAKAKADAEGIHLSDIIRAALAGFMNPPRDIQRAAIVAFLEDRGGDYDLRYSVSIGKLADDLLAELAAPLVAIPQHARTVHSMQSEQH